MHSATLRVALQQKNTDSRDFDCTYYWRCDVTPMSLSTYILLRRKRVEFVIVSTGVRLAYHSWNYISVGGVATFLPTERTSTLNNKNLTNKPFTMIESKRTFVKKELKTDTRADALYTVTGNRWVTSSVVAEAECLGIAARHKIHYYVKLVLHYHYCLLSWRKKLSAVGLRT